MANTYTLIEAKTLGSSTTTVSFTSIPSTYTDLVFLVSARTTRASVADNTLIGFNSSTANFSSRILIGQGGSGVDNATIARFVGIADGASATANTFSNYQIYIPNYTSSNYKSYSADAVQEDNNSLAFAALTAGLWSDTSVISSVQFTSAFGDFVQYSTFYLYGISNS